MIAQSKTKIHFLELSCVVRATIILQYIILAMFYYYNIIIGTYVVSPSKREKERERQADRNDRDEGLLGDSYSQVTIIIIL